MISLNILPIDIVPISQYLCQLLFVKNMPVVIKKLLFLLVMISQKFLHVIFKLMKIKKNQTVMFDKQFA